MGTGFSIDSALNIARYGISSTVSVVDDLMCRDAHIHHAIVNGDTYFPPAEGENQIVAHIRDYLEYIDGVIQRDSAQLRSSPLEDTVGGLGRYYELLPPESELSGLYNEWQDATGERKAELEATLRSAAVPAEIDVNVMVLVNRTPYVKGEPVPYDQADAFTAVQGFAEADINGSIVFSAGLNPKLYSYAADTGAFYPSEDGKTSKHVTLKVSDYRSAESQGRMFAKKGILVSEFRIESGENCGGHTFATKGKGMGPTLQEFVDNKDALYDMLVKLANKARKKRDIPLLGESEGFRVTYQGGLQSHDEVALLKNLYGIDGYGTGSSSLLVDEIANLDTEHVERLALARRDGFKHGGSSPTGIDFWILKSSQAEIDRQARVANGDFGYACTKGFLKLEPKMSDVPICTASKAYERKAVDFIEELDLSDEDRATLFDQVTDKLSICKMLGHGAEINYGNAEGKTPIVCSGPSAADFDRSYTLEEFMGHFYGIGDDIRAKERQNGHVFVNELEIMIDSYSDVVDRHQLALRLQENPRAAEIEANLGIKPMEQKVLDAYQEGFGATFEYYNTLAEDERVPVAVRTELKERLPELVAQFADIKGRLPEVVNPS